MVAKLYTSRLVLRELVLDDAGAMHQFFGDAEAMKHFGGAYANVEKTRADVAMILDYVKKNETLAWVMTLDAEVIGQIGVHHLEWRHWRAEMTYILRRDLWGKGLAVEAGRALLQHCFKDLGLHRIEARAKPANKASIRVMEKMGFKHEGLMRDVVYVNEKFYDCVVYALLAQEWQPQS